MGTINLGAAAGLPPVPWLRILEELIRVAASS